MLFVMCWPVALVALIAYPFVWLFLLPFRIVGVAVHGALALVAGIIMLPFRLLSAPFRIAGI
jgi:type IV secretory pathway TrbL component